jgi:hypothetical protein
MSRTRVRIQNALALLACSSLLVSSFGCNPGAVTAPDSATDVAVVESPNFVRILSTSKGANDGAQMAPSVSTMISAREGGTVTNGRITLTFPAGALDQDTEITMDTFSDGTLGAQFGPHGTVFNKPVVMSMDLRGTSAEGRSDATSTLYDNEDLDRYERMEKVPSGDSNVSRSLLRHFSKFKEDVGG